MDFSILFLTTFYFLYFISNTTNWIIQRENTLIAESEGEDQASLLDLFFIIDNFLLYFIQLLQTNFIFQMYFIKIITTGSNIEV